MSSSKKQRTKISVNPKQKKRKEKNDEKEGERTRERETAKGERLWALGVAGEAWWLPMRRQEEKLG